MSLPGRLLYDAKRSTLAFGHKYAPWDLTLRIQVRDNAGHVDLDAFYFGPDRQDYGRVESGTLVTDAILLKPRIDGCLAAWETLVDATAKGTLTQLSKTDPSVKNVIHRGQSLYRALFGPPNTGPDQPVLAHLREYLAAQRERPLRILIISDKLYVPWNLLYVDGALAVKDDFANGFMASRHTIVQQLTVEVPDLKGFATRPKLYLSQQRDTSLNIHSALDAFLAPLTGDIEIVNRDHSSFVAAIQGVDCEDDILYFCCHGRRAGNADDQASIEITEGAKLYPDDIRDFMQDKHFTCEPLVLINACYTGASTGPLENAFGHAFLSRGASTVLAPAVTIPRTYAAEFARSILDEVVHGPEDLRDEYLVTLADGIHAAQASRIKASNDVVSLVYSTLTRRAVHLHRRIARK